MKSLEAGYQIFPKFFSLEEMSLVRANIEDLCQAIRTNKGSWGNVAPMSALKEHRNPGINIQDVKDEPFVIGDLPAFSEAILHFILNENLWAVAAKMLNTDQVVYHFSNVTRKPAFIGPNINWHRDYPNQYICPADSRHFFRVLIPLEEMSTENGCTYVMPDSHRVSDETAIAEEKKRDYEIDKALPLEAGAGDVIALHPKIAHGGEENRSQRDRNLIVIQFGARTDSHLYWNEERFTGLARSEILKTTAS